MRKIWPWIDGTIYSFIPFSLLILFNILIIQNLLKASKNIENLKLNSMSTLHGTKTKLSTTICRDSEILIKGFNNKKPRKTKLNLGPLSTYFFKSKQQLNSKASEPRELYEKNVKPKIFKFKRVPTLEAQFSLKSQQLPINNMCDPHENKVFNLKSIDSKSRPSQVRISTVASSNGNHTANSASSFNRKLTIMLITVSITFCVTSMPIVALQTIEQVVGIEQSHSLIIIKGFFLVLQYLNHSINFFLYAITGKTFRREFLSLFASYKQKFTKKSSMFSNGEQLSNVKSKRYSTYTQQSLNGCNINNSYNNKYSRNSRYLKTNDTDDIKKISRIELLENKKTRISVI